MGLIKAAEIRSFNENSNQGTLYSIRFFGETGEFVDDKLVVETDVSEEFITLKNKISDSIKGLDQSKRKELLVELLSREMHI